MRPALMMFAIGLSGFIAFRITKGFDVTYLVAAGIGLIAAAIIYKLRRFEYGLMAVLLAAGLINFFTLPTGRDSRLAISLLLSIILLLIWGLQLIYFPVTGVRLRPSPINKPLLIFVFINILSYVWSLLMRDVLLRIWSSFPLVQIAALVVNIGLPLMALLTANKIKEEKWLKAMMGIVIALAFINIALRIPNLPLIKAMDSGTRGLFPMWAAVTAYSLALFHHGLKTWQRVALLVLVGLFAFHYFVQIRLWLSGWLPIFIALAVVTFFRSKKLFALLCLIILAAVVIRFDELYRTIFIANADEGGLQRFDMWAVNLRHIMHHPLFGMGPAGYAVYYMTYNPLTARSTHNNYFDIVAQVGIVGLVSFIIVLVAFGLIAYRTMKATRGRYDAMHAYAHAAFGGLIAVSVAMMLGDWVLPFAYNQTITGFDNAVFTWMMLGGVVSLYHLTNTPQPKHQTPTPTQQ
jgi:O-antigen ligase